jgi:hypothetical protein
MPQSRDGDLVRRFSGARLDRTLTMTQSNGAAACHEKNDLLHHSMEK